MGAYIICIASLLILSSCVAVEDGNVLLIAMCIVKDTLSLIFFSYMFDTTCPLPLLYIPIEATNKPTDGGDIRIIMVSPTGYDVMSQPWTIRMQSSVSLMYININEVTDVRHVLQLQYDNRLSGRLYCPVVNPDNTVSVGYVLERTANNQATTIL